MLWFSTGQQRTRWWTAATSIKGSGIYKLNQFIFRVEPDTCLPNRQCLYLGGSSLCSSPDQSKGLWNSCSHQVLSRRLIFREYWAGKLGSYLIRLWVGNVGSNRAGTPRSFSTPLVPESRITLWKHTWLQDYAGNITSVWLSLCGPSVVILSVFILDLCVKAEFVPSQSWTCSWNGTFLNNTVSIYYQFFVSV